MGGTRTDSHGAQRCNFNQLLEFIWAPKNPGEARPTVNILANGEVFEQLAVGAVAQRVYGYRDPVGGLKLTDAVDSDRLMTGLTSTDDRWYEAVPKVGNAVGEAWLAPANIPLSQEDHRISGSSQGSVRPDRGPAIHGDREISGTLRSAPTGGRD